MVYWLAGQGKDPDLCHFAEHVFLVAAERQNLTSLCRVLHHLGEAEIERKKNMRGESVKVLGHFEKN